jgi:hypothetical protein
MSHPLPVTLEMHADPSAPLPPDMAPKTARQVMTMMPDEPETAGVFRNSAKPVPTGMLPNRS